MTDLWTDKLSEYLDGSLPAPERLAVSQHLEACAECRETLAQLATVIEQASSLADAEPTHDLWPGIAGRLGPRVAEVIEMPRRRPERRITLGIPQLMAAGIALAILSGTAVWFAMRGAPSPLDQPQPQSPGAAAMMAASTTPPVLDSAIAELSDVLAQGRGVLDTTTVRILETNLAIIDRAIARARSAIEADPASEYLREHLELTIRRKLELMRSAADLIQAAS